MLEEEAATADAMDVPALEPIDEEVPDETRDEPAVCPDIAVRFDVGENIPVPHVLPQLPAKPANANRLLRYLLDSYWEGSGGDYSALDLVFDIDGIGGFDCQSRPFVGLLRLEIDDGHIVLRNVADNTDVYIVNFREPHLELFELSTGSLCKFTKLT